jgi:betaine-aldehyde dehydrogenase
MDKREITLGTEPASHWINGEWVGSSTLAKAISPSTGEVLGQYSAGGRVEAAAAIAAARKSFDTGAWPHNPQLRSQALSELADRLEEGAEVIALMLSREMGKTLRDATWEATLSPSTVRYNAGTALSQTGTSSEIAPGLFASAMREPIGVAGIIIPCATGARLSPSVGGRLHHSGQVAGSNCVDQLPHHGSGRSDEEFAEGRGEHLHGGWKRGCTANG